MATTSSSSNDDPPNFPLSGIAYTSNGKPTTFFLPPNSAGVTNPFKEPTATLSSASCGLILYRIPNSPHYYLRLIDSTEVGPVGCLPSTPTNQEPNAPLALVVNFLDSAVSCVHIVHARGGSARGSYIFEDFCVVCGLRRSTDEFSVGDSIIPNTAVSCGTKAYWLISEISSVVKYDTADNSAGLVNLPGTRRIDGARRRRQLGTAGGKLCYVLVSKSKVKVYILEGEAEHHWRRVYSARVKISEDADWEGGVPIVCREMPTPLRFESSCKLEVLLWVDGKLALLQSSLTADVVEAREIETSVMNVARQPDSIEDCVQIALVE